MGFRPKQLREMSELQLHKSLQDLQGELRKLRFLAGHGELKKVHQIKDVKRSIARVKSEVKAREMTEKPVTEKTDVVAETEQPKAEKVVSE